MLNEMKHGWTELGFVMGMSYGNIKGITNGEIPMCVFVV